MTFVIDASVTANWCFDDENPPAAAAAFERLDVEPAIAPGHWWFELRNVLLVGERRRRINEQQTGRYLRLFADLPVTIDHSPDETAIFTLARRHGLTYYDAAYLELALRYGSLATLDARLEKAAEIERVVLIGV